MSKAIDTNDTSAVWKLIELCRQGDAKALEEGTEVIHQLDHSPLCPHRVGGECLCIRSSLIEALAEHDMAP